MDFYLTKWINLHTNLSAAAMEKWSTSKKVSSNKRQCNKVVIYFLFYCFFFLLHVGLQDAAGDLCSLVRTHLGHRLIFPHGVRRPIGLDLVRKQKQKHKYWEFVRLPFRGKSSFSPDRKFQHSWIHFCIFLSMVF